jgi:histidinol-phosphate phosphatase family protein
MSGQAVFLDKDDMLADDVPDVVDPKHMHLAPQAVVGLRRLHAANYALVVVAHQPGVAHGHLPEAALRDVEARLRELFAEADAPLAGYYYCPHDPAGTVLEYARQCACRKPAPGLIVQAAEDQCLNLAASWVVGVTCDDVEAGRRAGCRTILIDNGHEVEWRLTPWRTPHHVAADLAEAAELVVAVDQAPRLGPPVRLFVPERVHD